MDDDNHQPSPGAEFVAAAHTAARALAWLAAAQHEFAHHYELQLPPTVVQMLAHSETFSIEAGQILNAVDVIDQNIPVAALSPRGIRWRQRLTPDRVLSQSRLATPFVDQDYRSTLAANTAAPTGQYAERPTRAEQCGRGHTCRGRRVYLPVDRTGPACYQHLDPHEATIIKNIYAEAVRTQHCAGCGAEAGHACVFDDPKRLQPIDGEWPRQRRAQGIALHKVRLDATET